MESLIIISCRSWILESGLVESEFLNGKFPVGPRDFRPSVYSRSAESWWGCSDSDSDSRLLIDSDSGSDSDSDSGPDTRYKVNNA